MADAPPRAPAPRLAAISVDLDEIPNYAAIHGLGALDGAAAHAVYDRCLPRFEALFDDLGIPGTFFVVGADVPRNRDAVARLAAAGHAVGNHSQDHRYDLVRMPPDAIRDQVFRARDAIGDATGAAPRGFRAPGYTVRGPLLDAVRDSGAAYDSSVFPCPAYWLAKTAAIGAYAALRRPSRSLVDDPRVLRAPADPYRLGDRFWRRGEGLLELPIGVTRWGRLPFIGTSVALAGVAGARRLATLAVGRPLVNLELHGIDLADAAEDGLEALAPHQPDLRRPRADKEAALRAAIVRLRDAGYRFTTLDDAARAFA